MDNGNINPRYISRPIQLLAAWFVGLISINASFLGAAALIKAPAWGSALLVIAAVSNVPIFLICLFLLQTKFRPEMQEDQYYSEYLTRRSSVRTDVDVIKAQNIVHKNVTIDNIMQEFKITGSSEIKRERIKEILTDSEVELMVQTLGKTRVLAELFLRPERWAKVSNKWRNDPLFKEDIASLQEQGLIDNSSSIDKVYLTELGTRVAKAAKEKNLLFDVSMFDNG